MSWKKLAAVILLVAVFLAGSYFAYAHWIAAKESPRESLLRSLPTGASAVIYVDVAELRQGGVLSSIGDLSAKALADTDYRQFVSETGFNYEKDLDRLGIAVENNGGGRRFFVLADGNFDRKKIETFLRKNGTTENRNGTEIFHVVTSEPGRTVAAAFLSGKRIALFDGADFNAELETANRTAGRSEWVERFARLAGSPVFALMRQDGAVSALLNNQAPGGIRSPQLGTLLDQLLWISIAGRPDGRQLRVILEGECPNEATMRQLSEFLNGIVLMANAGLNDPKLRQQMNSAEREAYQQLLNSAEVMKLDRGKSKAVRLTFVVTPEICSKLEQVASLEKPSEQKEPANANPASPDKKNGGPKQAAHRP